MEGFKLDVPAVVSQQVHHQLQVLCFTDVFGHDRKVIPVQKKLPEQLRADGQTSRRHGSIRAQTGALERSLTFNDCRLVT